MLSSVNKNFKENLMIKYFVADKSAVVWWDKKNGYAGEYTVLLNGEDVFRSRFTHCRLTLKNHYEKYDVAVVAEGVAIEKITVESDIEREFIDVTKAPYFADGSGKNINTAVLQQAIDDAKNGKIVYFPAGVYLTGALDLHSYTRMYLEKGATLSGSVDPEDYLPKIKSRYEGIERLCYRSLINVGTLDRSRNNTAEDVLIYGDGTIEGGGKDLMENVIATERTADREYAEKVEREQPENARVIFGRARGRLINISSARNVVIDGVTLKNGPAWNVHPIYSKNVVVSDCYFKSEGVWNGDGFDPDSSEDCVIFGCLFETGDDCIAIKSGKNPEGNIINKPCKNIDIFHCKCLYGHGIAIGSEMSGGVENVRMWNNDFISSGDGLIIKAQRKRGGYVRNVKVENCSFSRIFITSDVGYNSDGEAAPSLAQFENFEFVDVLITGKCFSMTRDTYPVPAISVTGYKEEGCKFRNFTFKNVTVPKYSDEVKQRIEIQDVENLTIINLESK